MTTSLLYHGYGIRGVKHKATKYENGQVVILAEMTHGSVDCPQCHHYRGIFRGKKLRSFHMLPFGKKQCFLELILHRVECQNCGHLYWPSLPFMKGKKRMVRSFMTYALELLRFGTIKDVANHIGIGWDAVKEIHQEALEKKYATIPLSNLQYVGIDEFSIKKRHKYMTVVTDLKTGKIIHAVEGRKGKDIEPFLKQLKKKPLTLRLSAST